MRSAIGAGSSYSTRWPRVRRRPRAWRSAAPRRTAARTSTGTIASSRAVEDERRRAHLAEQRRQAAAEHVRLPGEPRRHLAAVVPELLAASGARRRRRPVRKPSSSRKPAITYSWKSTIIWSRISPSRGWRPGAPTSTRRRDALLAHRGHLGGDEAAEAEPDDVALGSSSWSGPAGAGSRGRAARAPTPAARIARSRACRARTRWPASARRS